MCVVLSRLTRHADAEIILSLPRADEAEVEDLAAEYVAEGYANPLIMSVEISGCTQPQVWPPGGLINRVLRRLSPGLPLLRRRRWMKR